MSVQTYNQLITMPLGEIFKNITNENSHNLFNQPLTINFLLNDPIFVNNQFFYMLLYLIQVLNNHVIDNIFYNIIHNLNNLL